MKLRNIIIGIIDGLTIPFALATGLSDLVSSSFTIVTACIIVSIAGAITMTLSGYMEAKKYEPAHPLTAAITIGLSYIAGGLITISPYFFIDKPMYALQYSLFITLPLLFICGYYDSKLNERKRIKRRFKNNDHRSNCSSGCLCHSQIIQVIVCHFY